MPNLFTIQEAAPKLHISVITLRRLIKRKDIPYRRIGKKYMFTEEDILKFISKASVPMNEVKNDYTA